MALFTDTFFEANGVATLSRHLVKFAKQNGIPFLVVRGGSETRHIEDGSVQTVELKRGPTSFSVDKGLYCDPLLMRYRRTALEYVEKFKPDLVHVTSPGDVGFMGVWAAHQMRTPLVASWHTNLHQYFSLRLQHATALLPAKIRNRAAYIVEQQSLRALLRFYQMARFTLAPNEAAVDLLSKRAHRPAFLIRHGVDLDGYQPASGRTHKNGSFCIGYVGRLTTEKNIRAFVDLERTLLERGERNFRMLLVGEGGQRNWLRAHLKTAELPGVLRGDELAQAYQRMDAFVFPSRTDTFGLVVLEAMASGVPAIVPPETGFRTGVVDGYSGFVSNDFASGLQQLMHNPTLLSAMSDGARQSARNHAWPTVFEELFEVYSRGLAVEDNRRELREARAAKQ